MATSTKRNHGGLIAETLQPGGYYQSTDPGGFTDSTTGLHIPGPKVKVDDERRQVIEVTSLPDPLQVPTHKISYDMKDRKLQIECAFNRVDETPIHDGLQMALNTGIIRLIPDEVVKERYPKAWAKRQEKIVFSRDHEKTVPMLDLIEDAEKKLDAARKGNKRAQTEATSAATGAGAPPPPPPAA
ncbi:MAG: hypothetical protein ACYDBO_02230 [Vulcanimicrobiaceae bacterium]